MQRDRQSFTTSLRHMCPVVSRYTQDIVLTELVHAVNNTCSFKKFASFENDAMAVRNVAENLMRNFNWILRSFHVSVTSVILGPS